MVRVLEVKDRNEKLVYMTDERYKHILKQGFIITAYFVVSI